MRFFFLPHLPTTTRGPWTPPRELLRHLKALRLAPEEEFLLLHPADDGAALRVRWPGDTHLELRGTEPRPELPLRPVTLATAWPKGPRADELVARAAEAGVGRIQPLVFERSVAGREAFTSSRLERWRRLAQESCQQCRNPRPPRIEASPMPVGQALGAFPEAWLVQLVPGAPRLIDRLELGPAGEVVLLVGPEGGFSAAESALFAEHGIEPAGLLPTVLRIEAAGPLAAAICQHQAASPAG
ncbi:MAG: 16S rRNA (uracil(1498)-N(3))-methyltransferase [Planctomycetes bacterium]|nr:16S rRNA (uracil(1498)-N(3))-methyltransferase [Planctomycetota bacterium]